MNIKLALLFVLLTFFSQAKKVSLNVEITKTEISCFGKSDGKIQLLITGGKLPYKITWNNGVTTELIENLAPGIYSFKIEDRKGEIIEDSVLVTSPKPLSVSFATPITSSVSNFNATMNILIRGGVAWENQDQTSFYMLRIDGKSFYKNPEKISDGVHLLEIEDANSCTIEFKANLNIKLKGADSSDEFIQSSFSNLPTVNMLVFPYHLNM